MAYADVPGARLHYELAGDTAMPLLVLSNSLGTNLHLWDRVFPAFVQRFCVLRYDTRGHGLSSVPERPWTIETLARDALGLLDRVGIERCAFCGISIGGMTGMWLGSHAPERIVRLVLSNTAARIGTRESWDERICRVDKEGLESIADATVDRWLTPEFRRAFPDEAVRMRTMLAGTPPAGYMGCAAAIRDADLTGDLDRITAPALIVAGSHDPAIPLKDARVLCDGIPDSAFLELPTAHLSPVEQPDAFASAVLSFLGSGAGADQ